MSGSSFITFYLNFEGPRISVKLATVFFLQGVLDRFSQIKPKVIFSVDAVRYNNKSHNHLEKLTQVVKSMSCHNT